MRSADDPTATVHDVRVCIMHSLFWGNGHGGVVILFWSISAIFPTGYLRYLPAAEVIIGLKFCRAGAESGSPINANTRSRYRWSRCSAVGVDGGWSPTVSEKQHIFSMPPMQTPTPREFSFSIFGFFPISVNAYAVPTLPNMAAMMRYCGSLCILPGVCTRVNPLGSKIVFLLRRSSILVESPLNIPIFVFCCTLPYLEWPHGHSWSNLCQLHTLIASAYKYMMPDLYAILEIPKCNNATTEFVFGRQCFPRREQML